ncbi:Fe(2+) transport protein A/Fe(2+) transporter protein B [Desulfonema limicola]|uniref:Ferrous iron transport protein B n=1 Tax=Desulfonema limicola TaxID=45656 RepID=A0A975B6E9_9BACT|nr:ferrous iron transport protein B [Desulfonema limicola]QTA79642.1 Fe(2+) transport protein A/Fe(2+) transporter protein B [Desulfonema limicola]
MSQILNIALAGNPNAGKTTMFNALTGARQSVGNYPGVTVEKREGQVIVGEKKINIVDLPGTYSLTAYSQEELVARDYLVNERPHAVIDVVDASSLERHLYLGLQFMELGIPMILALNMMDDVRKSGKKIDTEKLSELLDMPVIETVARTGEGKQKLIQEAVRYAEERNGTWKSIKISYGPDLDPVLLDMADLIEKEKFLTDLYPPRWLALKYMEGDVQIKSFGDKAGDIGKKLNQMVEKIQKHCRATLDTSPEAIIADYRYGYIASVTRQGVITSTGQKERIIFSDKIDQVLTHRIIGPCFMIGVLYAMFVLTFSVGEVPMGWVEAFFAWLAGAVAGFTSPGLLQSLIVDGIIGGVGGVLGFVPLIMVMFLGISFLEDSGYMARMAYMMDRVLRIFGLHGCSVMPFIVSGGIPGGCAVPGVMGTRTLRSPKEKLATLMTLPFMPCGAKVPVFLLLGGAFFHGAAAEVLFWITIGAWLTAFAVSWVLRNTVIRGEATPFVMELPPYRMPTIKGIFIHTWERAWQYIKKAGTFILAVSILIWAAMTFPSLPDDKAKVFEDQRKIVEAQRAADLNPENQEIFKKEIAKINNMEAEAALKNSLAGKIGTSLESLTSIAGFDWRINIALMGGFAAKEVIVSTLGTAYSMGDLDNENAGGLSDRLKNDPKWDTRRALSLIVFVMLYAPCFITVVTMAKESSWKWAAFSVFYTTILAFLASAAVYQGGRFFL